MTNNDENNDNIDGNKNKSTMLFCDNDNSDISNHLFHSIIVLL